MADGLAIETLRKRVKSARRIVVLTGAGISADSGVPTFRGEHGLWRSHRAEDLATQSAFARDPLLVWQWYDWRRSVVAKAVPNAGHQALATLQGQADRLRIITQNVDGLHSLAGSERVIELHGSLWRLRCPDCSLAIEDRRLPLPLPPCCPVCGDLMRPDVVWFGEALRTEVLDAVEHTLDGCDLMLVVGTSGMVWPAAGLSQQARKRGAFVAELNIELTPAPGGFDLAVQGRAADLLPALL